MTNSSFEGWLSILSSYFLAIVMLWHGATWEAFLPFITGTGSLILMYGFAVRDWIISILNTPQRKPSFFLQLLDHWATILGTITTVFFAIITLYITNKQNESDKIIKKLTQVVETLEASNKTNDLLLKQNSDMIDSISNQNEYTLKIVNLTQDLVNSFVSESEKNEQERQRIITNNFNRLQCLNDLSFSLSIFREVEDISVNQPYLIDVGFERFEESLILCYEHPFVLGDSRMISSLKQLEVIVDVFKFSLAYDKERELAEMSESTKSSLRVLKSTIDLFYNEEKIFRLKVREM